jgi:hypothetical protein
MSTLAEIEAAIPSLTTEELAQLADFVVAARQKAMASAGHSVLDIPTVSVGAVLPPQEDEDVLGEMLEGRK